MNKRALMLSAATLALLSGRTLADTDVTTKLTSPINTATDGDITIESDGSVIVTSSSNGVAAVTINSNNVVINQGQISYSGTSAAVGVEMVTGYTGEFESSGKMTLTGTGTGKIGILISGKSSDPDSGTFTGIIPTGDTVPVAIDLESGSTLDVQGDESYGIDQVTGTNINGDIILNGTLDVTPTSDTSTKTSLGNVIAVDLQGTMTGNFNIGTGGVVTASGQGAEGVQTLGQITGYIFNQGTLETVGTTVASSNVNAVRPEAGTALGIGASVTQGIYNAGPGTTSDTTTVRALISTVGDAPTILINPTLGNATPTTSLVIGTFYDSTDPGYSFLNRGTISGTSTDPDVNVTTFSIVGASTTIQTDLTGGLFNGGSITAAATTNTRQQSVTANALIVGNYAVLGGNGLTNSDESNSGIISASVSGPESGAATAILIQQYGNLATIDNSGTIAASATTTNPQFVTSLTAYAIYDASGSLTSITNSGTISATTTPLADDAQLAIAADLSVSQKDIYFNNSGTVLGNVLFGTGADTLIDTGTAQIPATITGNVNFGGTSSTGGDDTLTIGDFGTLTGAVTEPLGSYVDVSIASGGTLN
ncbi:MAG: beta strand repeat-containing protein, partial [Rhizomicrobium sp.]